MPYKRQLFYSYFIVFLIPVLLLGIFSFNQARKLLIASKTRINVIIFVILAGLLLSFAFLSHITFPVVSSMRQKDGAVNSGSVDAAKAVISAFIIVIKR